jgi:hypothetical protein
MTERYIAALHGTTAAFLGSLELEALRHQVTIPPRQRPGRHSFHPQTDSCGAALLHHHTNTDARERRR